MITFYVTRKKGVPYKFGLAYQTGEEKNVNNQKLFWLFCWIVVDPVSGEVTFCKERRTEFINVKTKHGNEHYPSTKWCIPEMLINHEDIKNTLKEREKIFTSLFCNIFNWWNSRVDQWSVSIKKDNERITFSIEKDLTKKYFADRDKSIKTATGRAKKIFHYVKAHERHYESGKVAKIAEHTKGLDEFDWLGYHCKITAPEFKGLATSEIDISAVETDTNCKRAKEYISSMAFVKQLVDLEDGGGNRVLH